MPSSTQTVQHLDFPSAAALPAQSLSLSDLIDHYVKQDGLIRLGDQIYAPPPEGKRAGELAGGAGEMYWPRICADLKPGGKLAGWEARRTIDALDWSKMSNVTAPLYEVTDIGMGILTGPQKSTIYEAGFNWTSDETIRTPQSPIAEADAFTYLFAKLQGDWLVADADFYSFAADDKADATDEALRQTRAIEAVWSGLQKDFRKALLEGRIPTVQYVKGAPLKTRYYQAIVEVVLKLIPENRLPMAAGDWCRLIRDEFLSRPIFYLRKDGSLPEPGDVKSHIMRRWPAIAARFGGTHPRR